MKTASCEGDFVDHAVDSIITSLTVLVTLNVLVPMGTAPWVAVFLMVSGQVAFYLGCWAHYVLGRVLLGTKISGHDLFTVSGHTQSDLVCILRVCVTWIVSCR